LCIIILIYKVQQSVLHCFLFLQVKRGLTMAFAVGLRHGDSVLEGSHRCLQCTLRMHDMWVPPLHVFIYNLSVCVVGGYHSYNLVELDSLLTKVTVHFIMVNHLFNESNLVEISAWSAIECFDKRLLEVGVDMISRPPAPNEDVNHFKSNLFDAWIIIRLSGKLTFGSNDMMVKVGLWIIHLCISREPSGVAKCLCTLVRVRIVWSIGNFVNLIQNSSRDKNNGNNRHTDSKKSANVKVEQPKLVKPFSIFHTIIFEQSKDREYISETPDCHSDHYPNRLKRDEVFSSSDDFGGVKVKVVVFHRLAISG